MEKFVKLGLLILSYLESESYTGRLLLTDGINVMSQPTDGSLEAAINRLSDGNGQLDVHALVAAAQNQIFAGSSDSAILSLVQNVKDNNMDAIIETLLHIDFSNVGAEEHEQGKEILKSLPPALKGLVGKVIDNVPGAESNTLPHPVVSVDNTTKMFNQLSHGELIQASLAQN